MNIQVYHEGSFTFDIEQIAACFLYMAYNNHQIAMGSFFPSLRAALLRPLEFPHRLFGPESQRYEKKNAAGRTEKTEFGPAAHDDFEVLPHRCEFIVMLAEQGKRGLDELALFKESGTNPCAGAETFDAWYTGKLDDMRRIDALMAVMLQRSTPQDYELSREEQQDLPRRTADNAERELAKQLGEMGRYFAYLRHPFDYDDADASMDRLMFSMRQMTKLVSLYVTYKTVGANASIAKVLATLQPQLFRPMLDGFKQVIDENKCSY